MILLNEEKDWFENYSKAGKDATRYNKILIDAKKRIGKKPKKLKKVNPCPEIAAFEALEKKQEELLNDDNVDIFNEPKEKDKEKKDNKYLNQKLYFKAKLKYHDYHMNHLKKKEVEYNPSCTKYNPKYNCILKATKSCPSWEKQIGRKPIKPKEVCDKFYLEHDDIIDTMAGSAFIDMSKQPVTRQSVFDNQEKDNSLENYSVININYNNINYNLNENNQRPYTSLTKEVTKTSSRISNRSNNDIILENNYNNLNNNNKGFSSRVTSAKYNKRKIMKRILEAKNKEIINFNNISEINFNNAININDFSNNTRNTINFKKRKTTTQTQNINSNNTAISSNSIDMYNRYYIERMRKLKSKNKKKVSNSAFNSKSRIKAPDFSKNLSRESLDKLKEKDDTIVPYLIPDYSQVRPKPKMMVSYSKKNSNHKIYKNQSSKINSINSSFFYDADKAIENVNNHSTIHSPDFSLMSSRPIDNDPLPSYMKKIVDRSGLSEFSLNMNNYKNRDFGTMRTSFFPKQSFNKMINLNLLRSKKFFGNFIFGEKRKKFKKNNPLLAKVIRFYRNNFENVMLERNLKKFDNVTYKGIENNKNKFL